MMALKKAKRRKPGNQRRKIIHQAQQKADQLQIQQKQQTSNLINTILSDHLKRDPEISDQKFLKIVPHPYATINLPGIVFQKDMIFKGILLGTIIQYTDKAEFKKIQL